MLEGDAAGMTLEGPVRRLGGGSAKQGRARCAEGRAGGRAKRAAWLPTWVSEGVREKQRAYLEHEK